MHFLFKAYLYLFLYCFSKSIFAETIRIAITQSASIALAAPQLHVRADGIIDTTLQQSVRLQASSEAILVNGKPVKASRLHICSDGLIEVNQRRLRTVVEVHLQPNPSQPTLLLVHPLELENYVEGVVASEVPASFALEAQKAQAIAVRTYALWQKAQKKGTKPYDLESSVLDQVYHGVQKENAVAKQATMETAGQVLTWQNKVVPTFFHSTCGGHTEKAEEVWGTKHSHIRSVRCDFCKRSSPSFQWSYSAPASTVVRQLGLKGALRSVRIQQHTSTGRAKKLQVTTNQETKTISALHLRQVLGYSNMRSTKITHMRIQKNHLEIDGQGYGHGVGMCQWGTQGMAKQGLKAYQILKKYYPNTTIKPFKNL